jgi:hypothetical protein
VQLRSSTHLNISGEFAASNFGRRAFMTDANGDGFADLFFSAYLPAALPGKIYSLPGSAGGFTSTNARNHAADYRHNQRRWLWCIFRH